MGSLRSSGLILLFAATTWCLPVCADVFLLKSGGQLEGEWTNRDERRSAGPEVRTVSGIRVRLPKEHLETRIPQPKADAEYERISPTFGPSIPEQWQLAEWCRLNGLPQRRKGHLEAIIALETNHMAARRGLGYMQVKGQWQTLEQHQRKEGYELYRGRWRLAQDIEIQEERAKRELAEREWLTKLKRWRSDLTTDRARSAHEHFAELTDSRAVPAVETMLAKEPQRRVKIIYLDVLTRIGDSPAVHALIHTALNDADEEIFYESADRLKKMPPHTIMQPLVESLRDPVNTRVNRAAYLIGKMGDPKFISPLIDALITIHRTVVNQGGDTTSFGSDGSFGASRGGPAYLETPIENQLVLDALVELTGQNFQYNQRGWRRWYDIEKGRIFAANNSLDLRREQRAESAQ